MVDFSLGVNFGLSVLAFAFIARKKVVMCADRWLQAIAVLVVLTSVSLFVQSHDLPLPDFIKVFTGGSVFLALPAMLYLYARSASRSIKSIDVLWLLPSMAHYIYLVAITLSGEALTYVSGFVVAPEDSFLAWLPSSTLVLYGVICPLAALLEVHRHTRRAKNSVSDFRDFNLSWAAALNIVALAGAVFAIGVFLVLGLSQEIALAVIMLILGGQFGAFALFVLDQKANPKEILETSNSTQFHSFTYGSKEAAANYEDLQTAMSETKAYLKLGVSIEELASIINIPRHLVSETLSANHVNFFDFVNQYRIEEVKKLLLDPDLSDQTILGLAHDAGFSSKATFNRVFKTIVGVSPRDFRRQVLPEHRQQGSPPKFEK